MVCNQTEQPLRGEEGILPTMLVFSLLIVSSLGTPLAFCLLLQDRPQTLPHKAIDLVEWRSSHLHSRSLIVSDWSPVRAEFGEAC